MELKSCNKFWYVILVSFILCKGLKQLIPPFLWHREACRVQAGKLPLALMSLNEDQPSSVKLKRSCLQKKTYFRKQYCVKISEQLVDGVRLGKQETPLLRTAVCPVITTCKKPLSRSAAMQVLGWGQVRGDSCWERKRQEELVSTSSLVYPPSLQQPLCAPLHCSGFSITTE